MTRTADGRLSLELEDAKAGSARPRVAVPGELLVKFKSRAGRINIASEKYGIAATTKRTYLMVDGLQLVKLAPGVTTQEAISALQQHADIEYVEPNYLFRAQAIPNDPQLDGQWGLNNAGQTSGAHDADIDAPEAWDITTGNSNVVIAVLDSGVDYNHEDLAANIFLNSADCDADGVDDDANGYIDDCHGIDTFNDDSDPMDDYGHGTHVAGIVAAAGNNGIGVSGVAWNATILPCKFIASDGFGSAADAIACLDYIAALYDRGLNIVASNNSWGEGIYSRALQDAIDRQRQRGILFIASAGNQSGSLPRGIDDNYLYEPGSIYPCAYAVANVICVGAGNHNDMPAFTSNVGQYTLHVFAPGQDILSTLPGNGYGLLTGTSMAAPHVTGVAALLKAALPGLDWLAIRTRLIVAGDFHSNPQGIADFGWSAISRHRVNAHGALTCSSGAVTRRVKPRAPRPITDYAIGEPLTLAVLNLNCSGPNGAVSVTIEPGAMTIPLRDDGTGYDQLAGDGIYSASWTPSAAGTYTLSFPGRVYDEAAGAVVDDDLTVTVDPHLKRGFPVKTFHGAATFPSGNLATVIANIDTTPDLEIVISGIGAGPTYAFKSNGQFAPGWPLLRNGRPFHLGQFAAGNLQGAAGIAELVGGVTDDSTNSIFDPMLPDPIEAYSGAGQMLPGWPIASQLAVTSSPMLVDIDLDGLDEIFLGEDDFDLHGYGSNATRVAGFPVGQVPSSQSVMSPLAADLDHDNVPELILFHSNGTQHTLVARRSDGSFVPGYPLSLAGPLTLIAVGDVDGDGGMEIVATGDVLDASQQPRPAILIFAPSGALERSIELGAVSNGLLGGALADMNQDGIPEIVQVYRFTDTFFQRTNYYVGVFRGDGSQLDGWPVQLAGPGDGFVSGAASDPIVGDIDGDGLPEVVVTAKGALQVVNHDGSVAPDTPKTLPNYFRFNTIGTLAPAIADIDDDERNDIVLSSFFWDGRQGWLPRVWVYDLHGAAASGPIEWGQYREGSQHRAFYGTGKNLPSHAYVSVAVRGSGSITSNVPGIDCGTDCIGLYQKGTSVQLTATAAAGTTFANWVGACAGQGNPCTIAVTEFASAAAVFNQNPLSVTIAGDATGTVTSAPAGISCPATCSHDFPPGTSVTLTAVPAANSRFAGWSGACSGTARTCTVSMTAARSVTATFALNPLLQVLIAGGQGSVTSDPAGIDCGTDCSEHYPSNTEVTLTATPAPGYAVHWSGGCAVSNPVCVLTMVTARSVAIVFVPLMTLDVSVSGTGSGSITSLPAGIACGSDCTEKFVQHTSMTLTATADAESVFTGWSGACGGSSATCSVSMNTSKSVSATFTRRAVLTVNVSGNGTGRVTSSPAGINCGSDCSEAYAANTTVTLTAAPLTGSIFGGWTGACAGSQSTCTVTMGTSQSVGVTFAAKRTLSVTLSGTGSGMVASTPGGISCGADCTDTYDVSESVVLQATAANGSTFDGWTGACAGQSNSCTVTLTQDSTVNAAFRLDPPPPPPPLSSGGGGGGAIDYRLLALLAAFLCRRRWLLSAKDSHRG